MNGFPKTIDEQISGYYDTDIAHFDLKDKDGNIIASGGEVLGYFTNTYSGYKTQITLFNLWDVYNAIYKPDFLKAYEASIMEYNPLSNYDSKETNVYLQNDGDDTNEVTHGKTTTNTANDVTNETKTTSDVSTDYRNEEKTIQSGSTTVADSGTTTTVISKTAKNLTVKEKTYTADEVRAEIKEKLGNIGVTTSQQMLQSEIDLRLSPVVMLYLDQFANTYFYYVGGIRNDFDDTAN